MPRRTDSVVLVDQFLPAPGRTWLSLLPADADEGTQRYFQLLDDGVLEAWSDDAGELYVVLGASVDGILLTPSMPWPVGCGRRRAKAPQTPGGANSEPKTSDWQANRRTTMPK